MKRVRGENKLNHKNKNKNKKPNDVQVEVLKTCCQFCSTQPTQSPQSQEVHSNRTTYPSPHQQPHHHSHRSWRLPANIHVTVPCSKYTATMYTSPHQQPHHHSHRSSRLPSDIHMTIPCRKYTATTYTSPHQQRHQCTWRDAGPHHGNRAGTPAADLQGRPAPQPEESCGGWLLQRLQRPMSCPGDPQSLHTQPHGFKKKKREIKTHTTTWAGKRNQNTHNHMDWDQNTQPHGCQNAHNHTGWKKRPKHTQKRVLEKEIKTHTGLQINSFQRGANKFLSKTKGHDIKRCEFLARSFLFSFCYLKQWTGF